MDNNAALRKAIRSSLLEQLQNRGCNIPVFENLVEDYMELFDEKETLAADIRDRGITFVDYNNRGLEVAKENPSVKAKIMVHKQMLAILDKLGLKSDTIITTEADDEVEL